MTARSWNPYYWYFALFTTAAIWWLTPAYGQEDVQELDKVIVTGEKIERSVDETASSVAIISEEDLGKEADVRTVREAIKDIPNVTYASGVGQAPTIRGQDTGGANTGAFAFFGGTVPRAQMTVDGRTLDYYELVHGLTSVWDLNSIEVFRGPQTLAQGANANAGAVIINTNDPSFTPEGKAQMMFGSRELIRSSLALSGPLSEEFAGRLAIDFYERNSYVDYINPTFSKGETEQDIANFNTRLKFLWKPAGIPGLKAKFTYSLSKAQTPQYEAVGEPFADAKNNAEAWPSLNTRTHSGINDVSYELSPGVTLFNRLQLSYSEILRLTNPRNLASATVDRRNLSNETRVAFGKSGDTLSGAAGVFYSRTTTTDTLDQNANLETFFKPFYGATTAFSVFDDTKNNIGVYSEIAYRLTPKLTINGGLRYQSDQVERKGMYQAYVKDVNFNETFSAVLAKLSLAYEIAPGVKVGGLVNNGYNPGGITFDLGRAKWVPFEEETMMNYELFTRAYLLGGDLMINANLFYMDQTNAQRFVSYVAGRDRQYYTVNADKARSQGAELAVDYYVLNNLRAKFGAGFLETEITEFTNPVGNYEGNQFAKSPGQTYTAGIDWDVTPGLSVGVDAKRTGHYYSDDANTPNYLIEAYTVANARIAYKVSDQMEVLGFANNLFDDRSPTSLRPSAARATRGQDEAAIVGPREFIAGIKVSF